MAQYSDVNLAELPRERCAGLSVAPPKFMGLTEFMNTKFPPPDDLLHPILQRSGSLMIHGPTGAGKTHFAVGISVACCTGGKFLRYQATKPVGVLFADFECQAATIQNRFATALKTVGKELIAPLRICTPDLNYPEPMPDLATPEGQEAFDFIVDDACEVIVIDNLSTAMRAGPENESETWTALQRFVLKHRAAGRAVVLIQHEGKRAESGARGHSRQLDILDVVVQLKRPANFVSSDGARFEVHNRKNRHHSGDSLAAFEAHLIRRPDGCPGWTITELERSNFEIAAELFDMGSCAKDVASELHVSVSQAYRYRKKLGLPAEKPTRGKK